MPTSFKFHRNLPSVAVYRTSASLISKKIEVRARVPCVRNVNGIKTYKFYITQRCEIGSFRSADLTANSVASVWKGSDGHRFNVNRKLCERRSNKEYFGVFQRSYRPRLTT